MVNTPRTVRTSVLIISDTHNATPFPKGVPADLPPIDLLLHAGDLTMYGTREELDKVLDMLKEIPAAVKLVIPGNHDLGLDPIWTARDPARLHEWEKRNRVSGGWKGHLGEAEWRETEKSWFGPDSRAIREGVTMLRDGTVDVKLKNGARAKVYASPFTPVFFDWAFAYGNHQDRFNPSGGSLTDAENIATRPIYSHRGPRPKQPGATQIDVEHQCGAELPQGGQCARSLTCRSHSMSAKRAVTGRSAPLDQLLAAERDVDIMITHGPPLGRMDAVGGSQGNAGCPHLLKALQHVRPKLHCFGHIHEGWGAERIDWTAVDRNAPDLDSPSDTQGLRQTWARLSDSGCIETVPVHLEGASKLAVIPQQSQHIGQETVLVNAAIMDVEYNPINRPWLVYLDLPHA